MKRRRPRTVVSLFTGAGGLDIGLEAAGFETRVAVEMDGDAVRTLKANFNWPVIDRDLRTVSSARILDEAGLQPEQVDLLAGGPPCQPFSRSHWRGPKGMADPRASTLKYYLRALREIRPKAFLMENVPWKSGDRADAVELVRSELRHINRKYGTKYTIALQKLDAAAYGVPQHRERFFIIGHRDGRELTFPEPTHGEDKGLKPFLTAWDAIGDLPDETDEELFSSAYWADLLPSIPEGLNYLHHTDRGQGKPIFGWRTRYWSFLLKLSKQRPSRTLTANPGPLTGPLHWKNRRLSMREMCRLQTFPDNFTPEGSLYSIRRQIGNAVPCALAEMLGLEIRDQLLGEKSARRQKRKLLLKRKSPTPRAERTRPVPKKYEKHFGRHEAHPGIGKGPGAREQTGAAAA